jgi:hypothetical protein
MYFNINIVIFNSTFHTERCHGTMKITPISMTSLIHKYRPIHYESFYGSGRLHPYQQTLTIKDISYISEF